MVPAQMLKELADQRVETLRRLGVRARPVRGRPRLPGVSSATRVPRLRRAAASPPAPATACATCPS